MVFAQRCEALYPNYRNVCDVIAQQVSGLTISLNGTSRGPFLSVNNVRTITRYQVNVDTTLRFYNWNLNNIGMELVTHSNLKKCMPVKLDL